MINESDVKRQIGLKIIPNLDEETLFNMVWDAPLATRYPEARIELFTRRGKAASAYQNSLLGSWLKHWSTAKKLSFIKNNADKHQWLKLLDAALRDPLSSTEHKIRCCLLINKLFPNSYDITPVIVQHILSEISKGIFDESSIKAFVSEFSQDNMKFIITFLSDRINDLDNYDRTAAGKALGKALGVMAAYVSQPECDALVTPLLKKLADIDSRSRLAVVDDVWKVEHAAPITIGSMMMIAAHVSQPQRDAMLAPLFNMLCGDSFVRRRVLAGLSFMPAVFSEPIRDAMVTAFLNRLGDANRWNRQAAVGDIGVLVSRRWKRQAAVIALGDIGAHVSQPRVVAPLLTALGDADSVIRNAAATALGTIAPHVSQPQRDAMVAPLLTALGDADRDVRNAAAPAMMVLIPGLSDTQLKSLLELPGRDGIKKLTLHLVAQTRLNTRLHMNNPEWNPGREYGVYFKRKESEILQRAFDRRTQTWDAPRAFRLWSQVGGERSTVDDCITDVTNKLRRNFV
jgi:HEAT repeat protein